MYTAKENTKNTSTPGLKKTGALFFQPKLTVNQPGDIFEREADAMAEKVMGMTDAPANRDAFFRPAWSGPANNLAQRKCQACEEEEKHVHRKEVSGAETHNPTGLDSYIGSLHSSGQPLTDSSRRFFEPRFGHDFSGVRLHTDSIAAKSAQSINALAYTTGSNIVFNSGQYSPESDGGKKLLAHELTHVVQQAGNIQPKLLQRQVAGDPTQSDPTQSPTYVQPGGPFDTGDNIWTLTCDADGCRFGSPVPGAAPGADNLSFPIFCPSGSRRAFDSNGLLVCCPSPRVNTITNTCCDDGQVPIGSACGDPGSVPHGPIVPGPTVPPPIPGGNCPPSQLNLLTGQCCMPPTVPYLGRCIVPAAPQPVTPPQPITGTFPAGTIDDFDIDASVLNSRQTPAYQRVLSNLRSVLHNCPTTVVTITGFTDAPGRPDHNATLSQNRADSVKLRLELDLLTSQPPGGQPTPRRIGIAPFGSGVDLPTLQINIPPLILARSEGSANPVDTAAGTGYSARNRRVEVSMTMQCTPPATATR